MTRRLQAGTAPTFVLAAVVGTAILAAACDLNATPTQYAAVCVDRVTQIRVPDSQCGLYNTGGAVTAADEWDYIDADDTTFVMPRYGSRINITNVTVVHTVSSGATVYRSVPASGGTIATVKARTAPVTTGGTGTTGKPVSATGQGTTNSAIQRGGFGIPSNSSGSSHTGAVSAGS